MSKLEDLVFEGVTYDDVEWWQKLSSEEKQKIKELNGAVRLAFMVQCSEDLHLFGQDLFLKMLENFTTYWDYPLTQGIIKETNDLGLSENDCPIPYELHNRVDRFIINLSEDDQKIFHQQRIDGGFRTMNAFIRYKIKNGEL